MKITAILFLLLVTAVMFTSRNTNAVNNVSVSDSSKVCIVSGETIDGDGVKYKYLDKEITFCCGGCVKSFKKDPAKYLKEGLKCPVSGEDISNTEISSVNKDVKYYFCCENCKVKFEADPDKYLEKYNK